MSVADVLSMSALKITRTVVALINSALVTEGEPGKVHVGQVCAADPEAVPFQFAVACIRTFNWEMLPFMLPLYMALAVFESVPTLGSACLIAFPHIVSFSVNRDLVPAQVVVVFDR